MALSTDRNGQTPFGGFAMDTEGVSTLPGPVTPHNLDLKLPQLIGQDGRPLTGKARDMRAVGMAFPHAFGFIARQSGGEGTYWHDRFDECLRFNRTYAETMRNDGFLPGLMQERMLATYALCASGAWHLDIPNEKDPFQVRVRDSLTAVIKSIPFFGRMAWSWLEAIWYGKQGVQVQWGWGESPDPKKSRALTVLDWLPIQGDKIGHQFIDPTTQIYVEQPYILIDSGQAGWLERNQNAKIIVTTLGQGLVLQGDWRERFIIHHHLIEDSDWFHSDKAEAIHGVGVRSKIFWPNFLRVEWLANITDFFDRVGLGLTVWRFPQGNAQALAAIKQAANDQSNRAHLFVPIAPDSGKEQSGVERVEVMTSGASFLRELIEYLDNIIERYIVGQQASSRGTSSGAMSGSGGVEFQAETKRAITLMDSSFLAETLTGSPREPGLIDTMKRYTYPEADFPVTFKFDLESGESEKKLTGIKTVVEMGVNVKAADVRKAAGLSKPVEGDEVVQGKAQGGGGPDMPPGANPSPAGPALPGGPGGEIPQPGEDGGEEQGGGGEGGPSPAGGPAGSATWEKADTGVSPETGKPYSDSRYVNPETGSVKHFPNAPGTDENGKPVDGQRVVTSGEGQPGTKQPTQSQQSKQSKQQAPEGQPAQEAGASDEDAQALAQEYADTWNDLAGVNMPVAEHEIHEADAELEGTGWSVEQDENGMWTVRQQARSERRPLAFARGNALIKEIDRAAQETDTSASEDMRKAGNYRKGRVNVQGLTVVIESPKGSTRSGVGDGGKRWSVKMKNHYGYILRTESEADGDHVDVFLGPHPDSEIVFVIDQAKKDGTFDEHKCMLGFLNAEEAKEAYLSNYSKGWQGFQAIRAMPMETFREWATEGDTGAPVKDQDIILAHYRAEALRFARHDPVLQFAAMRAPYGDKEHGYFEISVSGTGRGGKAFRGKYKKGQFIPSQAIDNLKKAAQGGDKAAQASLGELEKAAAGHEASKQRQQQQRQERQINPDELSGRLQGYAKKQLPDAGQMKTATRSWRALKQYHGEYALHRLQELVDQNEEGLHRAEKLIQATPPDAPNRAALEKRADGFRSRLAQYHAVHNLAIGQQGEQAAVGKQVPPGVVQGEVPEATAKGPVHDIPESSRVAIGQPGEEPPSRTAPQGTVVGEVPEATAQGPVHDIPASAAVPSPEATPQQPEQPQPAAQVPEGVTRPETPEQTPEETQEKPVAEEKPALGQASGEAQGETSPADKHLNGVVDAALDANASLTPEQRKYYGESARKVIGRMTPRAKQLLQEGLKNIDFKASTVDLRQDVLNRCTNDEKRKILEKSIEVGGQYSHTEKKATLDGDYSEKMQERHRAAGRSALAHQTYAHEFGHGIDTDHKFSGKPEWQSAWKNEIVNGSTRLSDYAKKMPSEGFAEFSRKIHEDGADHAAIKQAFPQCFAVWEKDGLVATPTQTSQAVTQPMKEIFDEHVPFPGGHADGRSKELTGQLSPSEQATTPEKPALGAEHPKEKVRSEAAGSGSLSSTLAAQGPQSFGAMTESIRKAKYGDLPEREGRNKAESDLLDMRGRHEIVMADEAGPGGETLYRVPAAQGQASPAAPEAAAATPEQTTTPAGEEPTATPAQPAAPAQPTAAETTGPGKQLGDYLNQLSDPTKPIPSYSELAGVMGEMKGLQPDAIKALAAEQGMTLQGKSKKKLLEEMHNRLKERVGSAVRTNFNNEREMAPEASDMGKWEAQSEKLKAKGKKSKTAPEVAATPTEPSQPEAAPQAAVQAKPVTEPSTQGAAEEKPVAQPEAKPEPAQPEAPKPSPAPGAQRPGDLMTRARLALGKKPLNKGQLMEVAGIGTRKEFESVVKDLGLVKFGDTYSLPKAKTPGYSAQSKAAHERSHWMKPGTRTAPKPAPPPDAATSELLARQAERRGDTAKAAAYRQAEAEYSAKHGDESAAGEEEPATAPEEAPLPETLNPEELGKWTSRLKGRHAAQEELAQDESEKEPIDTRYLSPALRERLTKLNEAKTEGNKLGRKNKDLLQRDLRLISKLNHSAANAAEKGDTKRADALRERAARFEEHILRGTEKAIRHARQEAEVVLTFSRLAQEAVDEGDNETARRYVRAMETFIVPEAE